MRFSHQCHKNEIECGMQISPDSNRIMDAQKGHAPQAAWPEKTSLMDWVRRLLLPGASGGR